MGMEWSRLTGDGFRSVSLEARPRLGRLATDGSRLQPQLRTVRSDPQTWKDMAWLGVTSIVGFAGGLAVIPTAGLALTYVSMPLWHWAGSHPDNGFSGACSTTRRGLER